MAKWEYCEKRFFSPNYVEEAENRLLPYVGCKCEKGVCKPESCSCYSFGSYQSEIENSKTQISTFECHADCLCNKFEPCLRQVPQSGDTETRFNPDGQVCFNRKTQIKSVLSQCSGKRFPEGLVEKLPDLGIR